MCRSFIGHVLPFEHWWQTHYSSGMRYEESSDLITVGEAISSSIDAEAGAYAPFRKKNTEVSTSSTAQVFYYGGTVGSIMGERKFICIYDFYPCPHIVFLYDRISTTCRHGTNVHSLLT